MTSNDAIDMSAGTTEWTGRFFLPGPTEVLPEILDAQARPMIGHRGASMELLVERVQSGLQYVFRTSRPVYVATCSATGFMEAALRNGARGRVLSLVNGAFSERFFQIALACGFHADALEVPLGAAHTPSMVREALTRGRSDAAPYDAVTIVHSETSTGALNPVADIADAVHDAGDAVVLVDGVTSVAGTLVDTDAWGLDVILTGSQKALALPPGLAIGVVNERILNRAAGKRDRGTYFDFIEYEKYAKKNQTPNTPAVSLFFALAAQLERIRDETIEARWSRHEGMASRTWSWVAELADRGLDVRVLAPEGYRSPTVTCIAIPTSLDGESVSTEMRRRGFTIAPGYGPLKDRTIRIGHMGDHTVAELDALLDELGRVLETWTTS